MQAAAKERRRCFCQLPLARWRRDYIGLACRRPGLLLSVWTIVPLLVVTVHLLAVGVPTVETDISSSSYLATDGVISNRYEALQAAQAAERERRVFSSRRLLEADADGELEPPELADRHFADVAFRDDGEARLVPTGDETLGRRLLFQRERTWAEYKFNFFYEAKVGSIFSLDAVAEIRRFESGLRQLPSYRKFCYSRKFDECREFISAVPFLYGRNTPSYEDGVDSIITPDGMNDVPNALSTVLSVMAEKTTWPKLSGDHARLWYFDAAFPSSRRMRSRAWFGLPLEGYRHRTDRYDEQVAKIQAFIANEVYPFILAQVDSSKHIKINYEGTYLTDREVGLTVLYDALIALASLVLVWAYMSVYTRTPLLALFGMGTVILSIPLGTVIYTIIGYRTFPVINCLALFLVVGIGADNLFVLSDAWKQSAHERREVTERLEGVMRTAGKAIMACGTTTAVSFFANCFSSVRPLRSFGVFVGCCVTCNVVLCLGIFPLVLLVHDKVHYYRKRPRTPRETRGSALSIDVVEEGNAQAAAAADAGDAAVEEADLQTNPALENVPATPESSSSRPNSPFSMATSVSSKSAAQLTLTERFLVNHYTPCLRRCRFLVIIICIICVVSSLVVVDLTIAVSKEPPRFFPVDSNLGQVEGVRSTFGNNSKWAEDMEKFPLKLCKGCQWPKAPPDIYPTGCDFVGVACDVVPCYNNADSCGSSGVCKPDGRCECEGEDCPTTSKSSAGFACRPTSGGSADPDEPVCSGNGDCENGLCWCSRGYWGNFCQYKDPRFDTRACRWSQWSAFSTCSRTCGWGQRWRQRSIEFKGGAYGKACEGGRVEAKACMAHVCDVDCAWALWSAWGQCTGLCGTGYRERSRKHEVDAQGSGKSCEGSKTELEPCGLTACSKDCIETNWRPESNCSVKCGAGTRTEAREIKAAAGATCAESGRETRTAPCESSESCAEANCSYGRWADNGPCSVTCGEGVRPQRRVPDPGLPRSCEDAAPTREIVCSKVLCEPAVSEDCKAGYGEWSNWTECSAACGNTSIKTRLREGLPGCPGTEETQQCDVPACDEACDIYPWKESGDCSVTCGTGKQRLVRDFRGDTPPSNCDRVQVAECAAGVECSQDCELGDWVTAEPCSVSCGTGTTVKVRRVVRWEANGGAACPSAKSAERQKSEQCTKGTCAPTASPTQSPTASPTQSPLLLGDEQAFTMQLLGAESLTSDEITRLKKYLADIFGPDVDADEIMISVPSEGSNSSSGRRLLDTINITVKIKDGADVDLNMLKKAIAGGDFLSVLSEGPGFNNVSHAVVSKLVPTEAPIGPPTPRPAPTGAPTWSPTRKPQRGAPFPTRSPTRAPRRSTRAPTPSPTPKPTLLRKVYLPDSEVAVVTVVIGLSASRLPPHGRRQRGRRLQPQAQADPFNFGSWRAQLAVQQVHDDIMASKEYLGVRKSKSFLGDFKRYLKADSSQYPIGTLVHGRLKEFLKTSFGVDYKTQVGFSTDGTTVAWLAMTYWTDIPRKAPAQEIVKWNRRWDKFMRPRFEIHQRAVEYMYHTAAIWVRAETEMSLISSTMLCAVCSVSFAFLTVIIFLNNFALAIYLILSIVCVIICLAAIMFGVLGWPFGAVEAVGLIVFVGFSVDYALHVAECFNQSMEETRYEKCRDSLRRTGGAVSAAAMTSIMAAIPILYCTMQVFIKFGILIMLNTVLAYALTMTFFVALLMVVGPVEAVGPCRLLMNLCGRRRPPPEKEETPTVQGTVVGHGPGLQQPPWARGPGGAPSSEGYKWSSYDEDPETSKDAKAKASSPPATEVNPALLTPTSAAGATPSSGNAPLMPTNGDEGNSGGGLHTDVLEDSAPRTIGRLAP